MLGTTQLNICWWHSSPPPQSPVLCRVSSKWNYDNFHTGDNQLEREHRLQHTTNFFFHVSINWKLEVKCSVSFYLHLLTLFISSVYSLPKWQMITTKSWGHLLVHCWCPGACPVQCRYICWAQFPLERTLQCWQWRCWHREHDHTTLYQHWPGLVNIGYTRGDKCHTAPARRWLALITFAL